MGGSVQFQEQLNFTYQLRRVGSLGEAIALSDKETFDVALLDLSLPDSRGMKTLQDFLSNFHDCPTIVLTGFEDEKTGFLALQDGAVDYLTKGNMNTYILAKSIVYACIRKDNAALQKAKIVAEKTAEMKQKFLASMSHELRTPLNVITGTTRLLEQSEHTRLQQQYIEALKIGSQKLLGLVNNILDLSKIESDKIKLENHQFELVKGLNELLKLYSFHAREKKLDLYGKLDQLLPTMVIGDSHRLNQVLINLLDNAIKFTKPAGEVELKAKMVEETEDMATIRFAVADTGIGIKKEKLVQIFDSFVQADESTTRLHGGTGLGLSISQYLVSLFGGKLEVKSTEGEGSEFSFTIQVKKVASDNIIAKIEDDTVPDSRIGEEQINILLVEDHNFNQMVATQLLKNWSPSLNIDIANNGKEGVDKISEKDYDLVLMDIAMPIMDGLDATKHIREKLPNPKNQVPIIAMTAHALKSERDKCFKIGMNDFISKPIDPNLLYKKINKILNLSKIEMEQSIPKKAQPISQNEEGSFDIDLTYLEHLSNGDQKLKNTLIESIIDDLPKEMGKLKICHAQTDIEGYYKIAHKLKTTFGYVGLKTDRTVVQALEREEKKENFTFDSNLFTKFVLLAEAVVKQLIKIYPIVNK